MSSGSPIQVRARWIARWFREAVDKAQARGVCHVIGGTGLRGEA